MIVNLVLKKKLVFKSLLVSELWSWKVSDISKLFLESFKKINFKNLKKSKQSLELYKMQLDINLQILMIQLKIFFLPKEEWWDKILTEVNTSSNKRLIER